MNYILRIWKGEATGVPAHTEEMSGPPETIGQLAEDRVKALHFDPDKDDYTLAEHEVSGSHTRRRL